MIIKNIINNIVPISPDSKLSDCGPETQVVCPKEKKGI